jgi:hypothetical protein
MNGDQATRGFGVGCRHFVKESGAVFPVDLLGEGFQLLRSKKGTPPHNIVCSSINSKSIGRYLLKASDFREGRCGICLCRKKICLIFVIRLLNDVLGYAVKESSALHKNIFVLFPDDLLVHFANAGLGD